MEFNGEFIFDAEQYLEEVCADISMLPDEEQKKYEGLINKIDLVLDTLLDISDEMGYISPVDDMYPY